MNELENVLAELVKKGIEVAEQTGNFVIEQAPDLLQEFYRWHITKNVFFSLLCIIIMFTCFFIFKKTGRKENTFKYPEDSSLILGRYYSEWSVGGVFIIIFCIIGFLVSLGHLISSLYDLVFILTAPKLYLIEYFIN